MGCGLKTESIVEIKESLAELEELVGAAGGEVVGSVTQVVQSYNAATLVGSGKADEVAQLIEDSEATLVVIDHRLTGVQIRNLEARTGARVIDRSQLILDIFAQRAQTYEGKLQVELAQILDQMPRMVGAWQGSLSRQGGGIGTRGPGETALEIDRRRIRHRAKVIRQKLEEVRRHRAQHRAQRRRNQIPSFALIGYTNTGKSSLLNELTKSDVLAKDQVFATLDPTTRKVFLPENNNAVVTDTVGLIRKLPTHLIEAFKATLEESAEADILIHVMDISSPQMEQQMKVVEDLIHEFGWQNKPMINVYNKVDKVQPETRMRATAHPRVFTSVTHGQGLKRLKQMMVETIQSLSSDFELFFPRGQEYKLYDLGREAQITKTEESTSGTYVFVKLTPSMVSRWSEVLAEQ